MEEEPLNDAELQKVASDNMEEELQFDHSLNDIEGLPVGGKFSFTACIYLVFVFLFLQCIV